MSLQRCDQTEAWTALNAHFEASGRQFDLRAAFASDAQRFDRFSLQAPGVFADLSKNRWDGGTRALLTGLAAECGLDVSPLAAARRPPEGEHSPLGRPCGLIAPPR